MLVVVANVKDSLKDHKHYKSEIPENMEIHPFKPYNLKGELMQK